MLESFKTYRHSNNPKEKELHDQFQKEIVHNEDDGQFIDKVIFGCKDEAQTIPRDELTDREKRIALGAVQWLGSPVGESFLRTCGFVTRENFEREKNYGTPVSVDELVEHYKSRFLNAEQFKDLLIEWQNKTMIEKA